MKAGIYFIALFCFISVGYTAERNVNLQWDPSIDAPYLQSYRIYYYTTSGDSGSLETFDYAKSYTTLESGVPITSDSDPKPPITIDKSNTQITLNQLNVSKVYYFVVTAIDTRGLESIPTAEVVSVYWGTAVINPDRINAPWTMTGPDSFSQSGTGDQTLTSLTPGGYTLTWGLVNAGWSVPLPASFTLTSGGTITFTGFYTPTGISVIQSASSSLYFGYVPPGSYKDRILEVKNIGTGTLMGTVSAAPPFSIVSGGSYSLSANETQQVVVRYTAPFIEEGAQTGSLTFTGGGGITIQVKGTNKNVGLPWLLLLLAD